jgi:hypothetical protein
MKIITYHVRSYFLHGQPLPFQPKHETEWLRVVINRLYNTNKARLKKADVRTDLFHNHDEVTSRTKVLYPLIIYHYFDSGFYVTGLNEGKEALKELLEPIERAIEIDRNFLLKFEPVKEEECRIENSVVVNRYRLTDWLPFNSENYKRYKTLSLIEKIKFLETTLLKNIVGDFGKYLEVDLSGTRVTILTADHLKRSSLPYKGHDYQPFSIEFEVNVELPGFITLGNGKAFGFGRISRF